MVRRGLDADWTEVLYRLFVWFFFTMCLRRYTDHVRRRNHRLIDSYDLLVSMDGHPSQSKVHPTHVEKGISSPRVDPAKTGGRGPCKPLQIYVKTNSVDPTHSSTMTVD